ncbi:hypothetical protein AgCh_033340 [Apium graveolens]
MKVKKTENRLYKISLEESKLSCLLTKLEENTWLWHARLGHVNFRALELISKEEMALGIPEMIQPLKKCEGCLMSKQSRRPFPSQAIFNSRKTLEIVHADICGPIMPITPGGNRYFLLFVDDYSRKMWVYLLKEKSSAFEMFKKFKALVENGAERSIKILRTDRGGEFCSKEFTEFCEKAGIQRHYTAPYTPQQNGVVERRNRTVVAMTRSILKESGLPAFMWGEAVRHSIYVLNHLPTRILKGRTPYEAWYGEKPDLSHVRIFGCTAVMKVPSIHTKKLDDRGKLVVYLGKEPGTKRNRLYDPKTGEVHVSRDVVFQEDKFWSWEQEQVNEVSFPGKYVEMSCPMDTGDGTETEPEPTPLQSPQSQSSALQSSGAAVNSTGETTDMPSAESSAGSSEPRRYRSLNEIYNETEVFDMIDELILLKVEGPTSFKEAAEEGEWQDAMKQEFDAIERNNTWILTDLPPGHRSIGLKWVFKLKKDPEGNIVKHKARLVAKGYVQQKGIDYNEVFAPVARLDTIRLLLALSAKEGWEVHHLDVQSAFLNGELQEEVYVTQPEGFVKEGLEQKVYKLVKALYGLRQAPRAWNARLDKCLRELGFKRCLHEQAVYTRFDRGNVVIVGVYVDDLLVTGTHKREIEEFKLQMSEQFEMSNLGLMSFYLGIEVSQTDLSTTLKQSAYAKRLLEKTVGVASRFMEKPTVKHQQAIKHILRYVRGTIDHGLVYKNERNEKFLIGFSDSDLAGDVVDRRSTCGMCFYLNKSLISWASQKQRVMALSSCETEYMAATTAACQSIWLQGLLEEISGQRVGPVILHVDNRSAMELMKNPVQHGRSKHIDVRFHFIRECIERGKLVVKYVPTHKQRADILTKALGKVKFEEMRKVIGVLTTKSRQVNENVASKGPECEAFVKVATSDNEIQFAQTNSNKVARILFPIIKAPYHFLGLVKSEQEKFTSLENAFKVGKNQFLDDNKFVLVRLLTKINFARVYSSSNKLQVLVAELPELRKASLNKDSMVMVNKPGRAIVPSDKKRKS